MISPDNQQYVTVEMFSNATSTTNRHLASIDNTLTEMRYELRYNTRDTEHLQTSVYWGFAILGIIIAFVSISAPLLLEIFRESRSNKKHEDMKDVARKVMHEEISEAVAQAVNKALGIIGK